MDAGSWGGGVSLAASFTTLKKVLGPLQSSKLTSSLHVFLIILIHSL